MTVRILQILIFLSVIQPGILYPNLAPYRPFFIVAMFTGIVWFLNEDRNKFVNDRESRRIRNFVILFVFCEIFPSIIQLYFSFFLEAFIEWIKLLLIFIFVFDLVKSEEDIWKAIWAVLFAITVHIYISNDVYYNNYESLDYGRLASYGMYGGANDYGLLLTCSVPLILKCHERQNRMIIKLLLLGLLFMALFHIFLTGSRGSLIGGTVVLALALLTRSTLPTWYRKLIVSIVILGMIAVGGKMIAELRGGDVGLRGDDSSESRLDAWAASGRMLFYNPLGVGFGKSREHMREYGMYRSMVPHNTYVKVAAESGFIGIYAFATVLYYVVSRLMKLEYYYHHISPHKKVITIQALLIALVGFMLNTTFSQKEYELLLYVLLGCAARLINLESKVLESYGYTR